MVENILSPQIFLTLAIICAFICFFSSKTLISSSLLVIQSILVSLYYLINANLNHETVVINLLIILLSFLVFFIVYYFNKSVIRPWQKKNKLFIPISLLVFFIIYQKSDNMLFLNHMMEIKKDNLDVNELFNIYCFFSMLLIFVCSIFLFNNKDIKRKI